MVQGRGKVVHGKREAHGDLSSAWALTAHLQPAVIVDGCGVLLSPQMVRAAPTHPQAVNTMCSTAGDQIQPNLDLCRSDLERGHTLFSLNVHACVPYSN